MSAVLQVRDLVVKYRTARGVHTAVDQVSFDVKAGQTVALIGESGCGKSSLAKAVTRLLEPQAGQITFRGVDWTHLSQRSLRPLRRDLQMIFQDPLAALDGRQKIRHILETPLVLHAVVPAALREERIEQLLSQVGLPLEFKNRYPHELSGGQRQRVNIARALATQPSLIVCDEPVSALDVTLQTQVLGLLRDLQKQLGVAYLFISHDLSVVQNIADHILVMNAGKVVEQLPGGDLHGAQHPYTRSLIDSIPGQSPSARRIIRASHAPLATH